MPEYRYTVVFEPAEEGGYVVTVPALGGLTTQGETLAEARAMAKEAILGYLEAVAVLVLGWRLRRRSPDRHAGLRTLAKD